jgi:DNA-binding transcriptional regulator YiaG
MTDEYQSYTERWLASYRESNPEKYREIESRYGYPLAASESSENHSATAVQSKTPVYARAEDSFVKNYRIHPVVESVILVRKELNLTQASFARCLNISPRTLRDWEQGRRSPSGAALTLLQWAADQPDYISELHESASK